MPVGADLISVVEAGYRPAENDGAWLVEVLRVVHPQGRWSEYFRTPT